ALPIYAEPLLSPGSLPGFVRPLTTVASRVAPDKTYDKPLPRQLACSAAGKFRRLNPRAAARALPGRTPVKLRPSPAVFQLLAAPFAAGRSTLRCVIDFFGSTVYRMAAQV